MDFLLQDLILFFLRFHGSPDLIENLGSKISIKLFFLMAINTGYLYSSSLCKAKS